MIRALALFLLFASCSKPNGSGHSTEFTPIADAQKTGIELVVLGTIQDAGSPHIGCKKSCCINLSVAEAAVRQVSCLGIIDYDNEHTYLLDATPNLTAQLANLHTRANWDIGKSPSGIFLTHAHIGHYTGLMYFGREALGGDRVKTYAMPRMVEFLSTNGPWSQLVQLENISLNKLEEDQSVSLSNELKITPLGVPHRDEFSETVGFKIEGPQKSLLFIPDIDKWELWGRSILDEIRKVDYAFLDASFYNTVELGHRDPTEIPHPLVEESMALFDQLSEADRSKIYFIHLNHTNPLLNTISPEYAEMKRRGYQLAQFNSSLHL